jgi:hypothetical protein
VVDRWIRKVETVQQQTSNWISRIEPTCILESVLIYLPAQNDIAILTSPTRVPGYQLLLTADFAPTDAASLPAVSAVIHNESSGMSVGQVRSLYTERYFPRVNCR